MRDLGVALPLISIKARIIAVIQTESPEIFERAAPDGSHFKVSDSWVRKYVKGRLGWTYRKATRAAQKLPKNWEELLLASFLRHVGIIRVYDIPGALRVNVDQTQYVFQPRSCFTYEKRGAKQVSVVGKDEKRAVTIVVAVSASGELLPFQVIFKGRSPASLPNPHPDDPALKEAYREAVNLGFHFEYAGKSDTYWSTLETMKMWVWDTVVPYFKKQKAELGLRDDHECILQLDVWSVHASEEFRQWMWENHHEIILVYVPGGCTGLFQPCDVGIQRALKQALISSQNEARVEEAVSLFERGQAFDKLELNESLKFLRDRIPSSLVQVYKLLAPKKDFIKMVCIGARLLLNVTD